MADFRAGSFSLHDWSRSSLTLVAAAVTGGLVLWRTIRSYMEFRQIPCVAPGSFEMLGHMLRYSGDVGKLLIELVNKNGYAPMKLHYGGGLVKLAIVSSPDMQKFSKMPKGKFYAL